MLPRALNHIFFSLEKALNLTALHFNYSFKLGSVCGSEESDP